MSPSRRTATVLFLDIVGSTRIASDLGDARFRELISRFNRIVQTGLRRHGGHEEDRAGDGFFATFPEPAQGIRCACRLTEDVRELGVEIRVGIHTGETERIDGKTQGIAVVIGSRVMSLATAGEILVTSTTKELATGAGFSFDDFSAHELKGVPGTWQVWAVTGVDGTPRPGPLPAAGAAERLGEIVGRGSRRQIPRRALLAGLASAAIVAGGLALLMRGDDSGPGTPRADDPTPGTLLEVDPGTGRIVSEIPVRPLHKSSGLRHTVHALVVGEGGVWLIRDLSLIHLDPVDADVRGRPELGGGTPHSINVASGFDSIWVMTNDELLRIHPGTDEARVVAKLRADTASAALQTTDVAVGAGYVWVGTTGGELVRFDPRTHEIRRVEDQGSIDSVVAGPQSVWTSDVVEGSVTRFDPETMRSLETIEVSGGADVLVIGEAGVWVLSLSTGQITAVVDGENRQPVRVGDAPTSIAAGLGAIWVGDEDGIIRRIDEDTLQIEEFSIGTPIGPIAVDEEEGTLWVDVR
jgi:class 3 adenylate cyclase/streptogramin lyase